MAHCLGRTLYAPNCFLDMSCLVQYQYITAIDSRQMRAKIHPRMIVDRLVPIGSPHYCLVEVDATRAAVANSAIEITCMTGANVDSSKSERS